MIATSAVVKKTARAALKDNWLEAIAIGAIMIFAAFVICIAASLISIVSVWGMALMSVLMVLFLMLPLSLGVIRCYWLMMWDKKGVVGEVFYYFSSAYNYLKAILLFGTLALKSFFLGFLLLIPSIVVDLLSSAKVYEFFNFSAPSWSSNLWVASLFLKIVAGIVLVVLMLKYYLAPFLIIADEQMDVQEAIHKSTLLSRASGLDFVSLFFSFSGWIILSLFVIPLIATLPYFAVSYMVHSRFTIANYNKVVSSFGMGGQTSGSMYEGF